MNNSFSGEGHAGAIQSPEDPIPQEGYKVNYHLMSDGTVVVECEQDVEPVVEAIQHGEFQKWSPTREIMRVADIPIVNLMEWAKIAGVSARELMMDDKLLYRFIRDPDYRKFKIDK